MKLSTKIIHQILNKYTNYYDKEAYMTNHMLKVYGFAKNIAVLEGIEENMLELVEVGSILHDVGIKESIKKHGSAAGKYQELEGPPIAREWLNECRLEEEFVDRVCYLVGHHHSYSFIDNIDFQILVEADFLVNIHENKMTKEQVLEIREKYFKTSTGKNILDNMY
jgi:HD superfamily phosphodiesterase